MTRLHQAAVPGLCLVLTVSGATLFALAQGPAPVGAERDPSAPAVFRLPPSVRARPLTAVQPLASDGAFQVSDPRQRSDAQHLAVQFAPRRLAKLPPVVEESPGKATPFVLRRTPPTEPEQSSPALTTPVDRITRTPEVASASPPSVSVPGPVLQLAPPALQTPASPPAETGVAPQRLPSPLAAPRQVASPALAAVARRADQLVQHGTQLAGRRAFYSARSEFIEALSVIAQALDMESGAQIHSAALAEGLRALDEANDFVAYGARLEADLNVEQIVAAHRTPVLKPATGSPPTPLAALQQYYMFAQSKFAIAAGQQPSASRALYALGKLQTALAHEPLGGTAHEARAIVFHQAAIAADPANAESANELGVLLARCGQYEDAKRLLLQSLSVQRRPEAWHNLAVVHDALGEHQLAEQARYELNLAQASGRANLTSAAAATAPAVQWIDAAEFARISRAGNGEQQ